MRNVLVAVFWTWLLVALGVYAYRISRRIARRSTGADEPAAAEAPPAPVEAPPGPVAGPPVGLTADPPPRAGPSPTSSPPSSPPPTGGDEGDGRRGLFAARPEPAPERPSDAPPPGRPTVAEAVTGIAVPCDLVPLVGGEARIDPYRVVFSTDRADAATVGAALADELERLGYSLRSTSDHEAVAVRADLSLSVAIVTDLAGFPTAPPGGVVVVLST